MSFIPKNTGNVISYIRGMKFPKKPLDKTTLAYLVMEWNRKKYNSSMRWKSKSV